MSTKPASTRTRLERHPERGAHDRATIHAILDETLVCHVGFVHDGSPVVVPTLHARVEDTLYLHGSPISRMVTTLASGCDVCVTATLVDGLVLARSVFDHSVNYRSVMAFGRAWLVEDPAEKLVALEALTEHLVAGRWGDARPPDERELAATAVLGLALDEASAKVRSGPPGADAERERADVWAGVVPLRLVGGPPEAAADVPADVAIPAYLQDLEGAWAERGSRRYGRGGSQRAEPGASPKRVT